MGIKTLGAVLLIGATGMYVAYPKINDYLSQVPGSQKVVRDVRQRIGVEETVREEAKSVLSKIASGLSDFFKNNNSQTENMHYSDGTKIEPWNYHGNSWPSNWPTTNSDGSFNRDYMRWYQEQSRGTK